MGVVFWMSAFKWQNKESARKELIYHAAVWNKGQRGLSLNDNELADYRSLLVCEYILSTTDVNKRPDWHKRVYGVH